MDGPSHARQQGRFVGRQFGGVENPRLYAKFRQRGQFAAGRRKRAGQAIDVMHAAGRKFTVKSVVSYEAFDE